jgi:phosphopantothenoylcysteine synthetase/decarboxylase
VHDYDVRKKNALKFIKQGNRVKCTVMFRGREVQYEQLGAQLLEKLAADLDTVCLREGKAKREGRNLSLILSPRAEVMKAVSENRKAEERAKKRKKLEAFGTVGQEDAANGTANGSIQTGEGEGLSYEDDDEDEEEDDDDYDDDDDDEDDDDDDEEEATLDELLGGDDLSDALFK